MPPRSTSPEPAPGPLEIASASSFDSDCQQRDDDSSALLPGRRRPLDEVPSADDLRGTTTTDCRSLSASFILGGVTAIIAAYVCRVATQNNAHSLSFGVVDGRSPVALDGLGSEWSAPPSSWLDARAARFANISESKCRHPQFFDADYAYYDMADGGGSYVMPWEEVNRRYYFKRKKSSSNSNHKKEFDRMKKELKSAKKKKEKKKKKKGEEVEEDTRRNIAFVHIGKAGGSSLLCNIREAFDWGRSHCPGYVHGNHLKFPYDSTTESAISRQVNCYAHYNERTYCYDLDSSFLVNVRNPIHRLASWYLYEHVANFDVNVDKVLYPSRPKHCGQLMLYTCYDSFDDLATIGLARPRPARGTTLRVGKDLTEAECSGWAWAAVQGNVPASFHNVWNYDWYVQYLLEKKEYEIFVLRIEHLDQDWSTVDRIVGGDGAPLPASSSHANEASSKPLPVSNKTASEMGLANLCRALCDEIQAYKRILARAANLNDDDLNASMEELRKTCPEEVDIAPRKCSY